ncbi:unnamed protein product [Chrysoparadoxa australica]
MGALNDGALSLRAAWKEKDEPQQQLQLQAPASLPMWFLRRWFARATQGGGAGAYGMFDETEKITLVGVGLDSKYENILPEYARGDIELTLGQGTLCTDNFDEIISHRSANLEQGLTDAAQKTTFVQFTDHFFTRLYTHVPELKENGQMNIQRESKLLCGLVKTVLEPAMLLAKLASKRKQARVLGIDINRSNLEELSVKYLALATALHREGIRSIHYMPISQCLMAAVKFVAKDEDGWEALKQAWQKVCTSRTLTRQPRSSLGETHRTSHERALCLHPPKCIGLCMIYCVKHSLELCREDRQVRSAVAWGMHKRPNRSVGDSDRAVIPTASTGLADKHGSVDGLSFTGGAHHIQARGSSLRRSSSTSNLLAKQRHKKHEELSGGSRSPVSTVSPSTSVAESDPASNDAAPHVQPQQPQPMLSGAGALLSMANAWQAGTHRGSQRCSKIGPAQKPSTRGRQMAPSSPNQHYRAMRSKSASRKEEERHSRSTSSSDEMSACTSPLSVLYANHPGRVTSTSPSPQA